MARAPEPFVEQELPGIGRRYELADTSGQRMVVVVHHSGRRDVYALDRNGDVQSSLAFSDDQARRLGALLAGVLFTPAAVAQVEAVIGGLLIDWVTLHAASPAVGRSIAELEVRRRTRMTIAALLRGDATIVAPEPSEVLQVDDRLVVMGRPGDLPTFLAAVVG